MDYADPPIDRTVFAQAVPAYSTVPLCRPSYCLVKDGIPTRYLTKFEEARQCIILFVILHGELPSLRRVKNSLESHVDFNERYSVHMIARARKSVIQQYRRGLKG